GVACGTVTCESAGACCAPSGACTFVYQSQCTLVGGVWSGAGTPCATANCPQPGACCFPAAIFGGCQIMQPTPCATAGGTFQGAGTNCAQGACWSAGIIWNNGPLGTGDTNTDGEVAPAGTTWSEIQAGNMTAVGFWDSPSTATFTYYNLADDFTITSSGGAQ